MLEILQYVTSSFGAFIGSIIFVCGTLASFGWAMNAALLGWRGKKIDS